MGLIGRLVVLKKITDNREKEKLKGRNGEDYEEKNEGGKQEKGL